MSKCYYINLSRKEIAIVSYFPAWELKNKPKAEWIETVLIPLLLPLARRKNKKISDVPITFWAFTRHTARSSEEELFLFMTPADPSAVVRNIIEEALKNIKCANVFAGLEPIPACAFPVCQVFRGKIIRFYYGEEGVKQNCLPTFKWTGDAPVFSLSDIAPSVTMLENRDPEILFMRANMTTVMNGKYYTEFQQNMNCICIEERE